MGNLSYYNGIEWRRLSTGTELYLLDIFSSGNGDIYAAGVGDRFLGAGDTTGILLKGNYSGFTRLAEGRFVNEEELFNPYLYGEMSSVWVDENENIYTGGRFLYQLKNRQWDFVHSLPENFYGANAFAFNRGYIQSIRGNSSNDYVIVGQRNTIRHFNGIRWNQLGMPYDVNNSIDWYRVEIKNNVVVACGTRGGSTAIIIMLKR